MAAAISLPFFHPVLMTVVIVAICASIWGAPEHLRARRWWVLASVAIGLAVAGLTAVLGVIPWFGRIHLAVYSICLLGGFVVAFVLARQRAICIGVRQQWLIDAFGIAVILGIVGARARYVYERWDAILGETKGDVGQAVLLAADLDRGGAVWYGGVALAAIGVALYMRFRRVSLLPFADVGLPALLGGLAVGRLGCWFNGCCYGSPTTLPWGVSCPTARYQDQLVHPTQLYETLACALLATLLMWFWKNRRRDGQVAFASVVGYAVWRFCNEGLRGDHDVFAYGGTAFTTSQATSIHLILAAILVASIVIWRRKRYPYLAVLSSKVPGSRFSADGS